jgi:hypothetical protein
VVHTCNPALRRLRITTLRPVWFTYGDPVSKKKRKFTEEDLQMTSDHIQPCDIHYGFVYFLCPSHEGRALSILVATVSLGR